MKTAKDQWIQMQCKSINEDMKYGRHNKRAYETLKSLTKTPARSTSIIEDKNGQPLAEEYSIFSDGQNTVRNFITFLSNLTIAL